MDKSLSVNEILADAWALAKKNIVVLLGFSMDEVKETTSRNAIELFQLQNFIHLNHD